MPMIVSPSLLPSLFGNWDSQLFFSLCLKTGKIMKIPFFIIFPVFKKREKKSLTIPVPEKEALQVQTGWKLELWDF